MLLLKKSMRFLSRAAALLMFIFPIVGYCLKSTVPNLSKAASADIADALSMDGLAGYIEGVARGAVADLISKDGTDWICDAVAASINDRRRGLKGENLESVFRQNEELKGEVREKIREKVRSEVGELTKGIIVEKLFPAVAGKETADEISRMAEAVVRELDTTFSEGIDRIADSIYQSYLEKAWSRFSAMGIPYWVDPHDLRKSIEGTFDLHRVATLSSYLGGKIIGDAAASGIRNRVVDILKGDIPPELARAIRAGPEALEKYFDMAEANLPGRKLEQALSGFLKRPVIKIPTPAYVAILGASAAAHFARAFNGIFVDAYELKRGAEVLRVMAWHAANKDAINMSVMQLASLSRELAFSMGIGDSFDSVMDSISAPLDAIRERVAELDNLIKKPIAIANSELKSIVSALEDNLKAIQDSVFGPLKYAAADVSNRLSEFGRVISSSIPDSLNGIPKNFSELKDRAGIPDDLFGDFGELSASDLLHEIADATPVRDAAGAISGGLSDLADGAAEAVAAVASEALYAAHLIGPTARIMGCEKISSYSEKSGSLDPVYMHNGEFFAEITDLFIQAAGFDIEFRRIYRSRSDFLGELGWGWTHSYAERSYSAEGGYTFIDERGVKHRFETSNGEYRSADIPGAVLYASESGTRIRLLDGTVKIFDSIGRILKKVERHGLFVSYEYGTGGLLSKIVDAHGREVSFRRRADGLIDHVEDFSGRRIAFKYNDRKELVEVISPPAEGYPSGKGSAYRYFTVGKKEHLLFLAIDPSGYPYLSQRYDEEGRVIAQRYGAGDEIKIAYLEGDGMFKAVLSKNGRDFETYTHDSSGRMVLREKFFQGEMREVEKRSYDKNGMLASIVTGDLRTSFLYDPASGLPVRVERLSISGGEKRVSEIEREPRHGRPSKVKDEDGLIIRYLYFPDDDSDLEAVEVMRDGRWQRRISFRRNECGDVKEIETPYGRVLSVEYNSTANPEGAIGHFMASDPSDHHCGYIRSISDFAGSRRYIYDSAGNIIATISGGGREIYAVNSLNQVEGESSPGMPDRLYRFDWNDNLIEAVISSGKRSARRLFEYLPMDLLKSERMEISPGVFVRKDYSYDASGRISKISEGNRSTAFSYDDAAGKFCEISAPDSLERSASCVFTDVDGRIVGSVDGSGARTFFTRNGFGDLNEILFPSGMRQAISRNSSGNLISVENLSAEGEALSRREFKYDDLSGIFEVSDDLWTGESAVKKISVKYSRDLFGNIETASGPGDSWFRIGRDSFGRPSSILYSSGVERKFFRDRNGRITKVSEYACGQSRTLFEFLRDEAERIVRSVDHLGRVSELSYDDMGNLSGYEGPRGSFSVESDFIGRPVLKKFSSGEEERFTWNDGGMLSGISSISGEIRFGYDSRGLLVSESYPWGYERNMAYDGAGKVAGIIKGGGQHISIIRDQMGRVLSRVAQKDGFSPVIQRYRYDGLGRVIAAVEGERVYEYLYDSLSRVVAESGPNGLILKSYDEFGRPARVVMPDGKSQVMIYDSWGNLSGLIDDGRLAASFEYGCFGELEDADYGGNLTEKRSSDSMGRISSISYLDEDGLVLDRFETYWNNEGMPAADAGRGGSLLKYSRNFFGGLQSVGYFRKDDIDETLLSEESFAQHIISNEDLSIDASGHVQNLRGFSLSYDPLGRLSSISNDGKIVALYEYDPFDRRVLKRVGGSETAYLWSGWTMLGEISEKRIRYLYGADRSVPFGFSGDGSAIFLRDRLQSGRGALSEKIFSHRDYSPFGKELEGENSGYMCFAGHYCDYESGLVYMRNRYYDKETGKFLSPDPLGIKTPLEFAPSNSVGQGMSYHNLQGSAFGTSRGNRGRSPVFYGVYLFRRIFMRGALPQVIFAEKDPYLYASGDPTINVDPLGLASLIFDRSDEKIYLHDGQGNFVTSYLATNRVVNQLADPLSIGMNGPFPNGTYSLGVPEFYSQEYREGFYRKFGLGEIGRGEGVTSGHLWARNESDSDDYSESFGRIRFRIGDPSDGTVWQRGLFIHGGRNNYRARTLGCIRADDLEMETLSANFIAFMRQGDPIIDLTVRE